MDLIQSKKKILQHPSIIPIIINPYLRSKQNIYSRSLYKKRGVESRKNHIPRIQLKCVRSHKNVFTLERLYAED